MKDTIATPLAMPEATMPDELKTAMEKLKAAQSELQRIQSLIAAAQRDRADAEREHEQAFSTLAEAEAAAAMGGGKPDDSLRKKVEQHQMALLTHNARITGLQVRERDAAAVVSAAAQELSQVTEQWSVRQREAAGAAYQAALDRFIAEVARPIGIGLALNDSRLGMIARASQLFAFDNTNRNAWDAIRYYKDNESITSVLSEHTRILKTVRTALESAGVGLTYPAATIN